MINIGVKKLSSIELWDMRNLHIALISAMPEEIGNTLNHLDHVKSKKFGDLAIYFFLMYHDRMVLLQIFQASPYRHMVQPFGRNYFFSND